MGVRVALVQKPERSGWPKAFFGALKAGEALAATGAAPGAAMGASAASAVSGAATRAVPRKSMRARRTGSLRIWIRVAFSARSIPQFREQTPSNKGFRRAMRAGPGVAGGRPVRGRGDGHGSSYVRILFLTFAGSYIPSKAARDMTDSQRQAGADEMSGCVTRIALP